MKIEIDTDEFVIIKKSEWELLKKNLLEATIETEKILRIK